VGIYDLLPLGMVAVAPSDLGIASRFVCLPSAVQQPSAAGFGEAFGHQRRKSINEHEVTISARFGKWIIRSMS
jgi:hypothetical protein